MLLAHHGSPQLWLNHLSPSLASSWQFFYCHVSLYRFFLPFLISNLRDLSHLLSTIRYRPCILQIWVALKPLPILLTGASRGLIYCKNLSTERLQGLSMEETTSRKTCLLTSSLTYFTPLQTLDRKLAKCMQSSRVSPAYPELTDACNAQLSYRFLE